MIKNSKSQIAVLLPVQPKWCEFIAVGRKGLEIRKSMPKLEVPFKVYIYQTKKTWIYDIYSKISDWQGKVIGEFVCDEVKEFTPCPVRLCGLDYNICVSDFASTCLTAQELNEYGKGKTLYGWHISDLKIYDKPKELSEFRLCHKCPYGGYENCLQHEYSWDGTDKLNRPPQSYCYVEEMPL